jgi:hypothetical protein
MSGHCFDLGLEHVFRYGSGVLPVADVASGQKECV